MTKINTRHKLKLLLCFCLILSIIIFVFLTRVDKKVIIHERILEGDINYVKEYIENGGDINIRNEETVA